MGIACPNGTPHEPLSPTVALLCASVAMLQDRPYKFPEQRMRTVGTALELRMELNRHKEGVRGNLDDLHQIAVGVAARGRFIPPAVKRSR